VLSMQHPGLRVLDGRRRRRLCLALLRGMQWKPLLAETQARALAAEALQAAAVEVLAHRTTVSGRSWTGRCGGSAFVPDLEA